MTLHSFYTVFSKKIGKQASDSRYFINFCLILRDYISLAIVLRRNQIVPRSCFEAVQAPSWLIFSGSYAN